MRRDDAGRPDLTNCVATRSPAQESGLSYLGFATIYGYSAFQRQILAYLNHVGHQITAARCVDELADISHTKRYLGWCDLFYAVRSQISDVKHDAAQGKGAARSTAITLLFLAFSVGAPAQLIQRSELATQLLRCSTLYLAISDARGERYQDGRNSGSFLFRGMAYQGMALALMNSKFVSSELDALEKSFDSRSASERIASLSAISSDCAELPVRHTRLIEQAFEQLKRRREGDPR